MAGREEHIRLDGKKFLLDAPREVERAPITPWPRKIGGGDTKYSEFDKWSVRAYSDTHVGRAQEWDDGLDGRFMDSTHACTRYKGQVTLNPRHYIVERKTADEGNPEASSETEYINFGWPQWKGTNYQVIRLGKTNRPKWLAQSFKYPKDVTADKLVAWVGIHLGRVGLTERLPFNITFAIYSNSAGNPGASLISKTFTRREFRAAYGDDVIQKVHPFADLTDTVELTGGTHYWAVITTSKIRENGWYKIHVDPDASYLKGVLKGRKTDGGGWVTRDEDLYFRVGGTIVLVVPGDDITIVNPIASVVATTVLEGVELPPPPGDGPGGILSGEPVAIVIFDDGGGDDLYVLAGKKVYRYDAGSKQMVNDHAGLSGDGHDMKVFDDVLYVSQGTAGPVRRKRAKKWKDVGEVSYTGDTIAFESSTKKITDEAKRLKRFKTGETIKVSGSANNDGTYTIATGGVDEEIVVDEALTNEDAGAEVTITSQSSDIWEARCLAVAPNFDGDTALWMSKAGTGNHQVRHTTDGKTLSDWIECGDSQYAVRKMFWYAGEVWVGKDDQLGSMDRSTMKFVPQFPFPTQASTWNFRASCVWHKNDLMLNVRESVWHWNMGSQFRNIGPTKGIGFPKSRKGHIGAMLPLVNRLLVAIDAGDGHDRYSSIVSYNGIGDVGWHEEFRAPIANKRIRCMFYTPRNSIESEPRLWFGLGRRMAYIFLPDLTDDPTQWTARNAKFCAEGSVILPVFDGFLRGIDKDWRLITVECYGLHDDDRYCRILYRTQMGSRVWKETEWTLLGIIGSEANVAAGRADVSPIKGQADLEFPLDSYSKLIQICPVLETRNEAKTPRLQSVILKYWPKADMVNSWSLTVKLQEPWQDEDTEEWITWETQFDDFWEIAAKKEPIKFIDLKGDEWTVVLDPPPRQRWIMGGDEEPRGARIRVWLSEAS